MILVDTSVWVDFMRGADSSQSRMLHRLIEGVESLAITEIILTEILQGIKNDRNFRTIREYLLEFPIIRPNGVETYILAADIYRSCRKRGGTVRNTVDCIIAAVCIENDLSLLHKDSDFETIEKFAALKVVRT